MLEPLHRMAEHARYLPSVPRRCSSADNLYGYPQAFTPFAVTFATTGYTGSACSVGWIHRTA